MTIDRKRRLAARHRNWCMAARCVRSFGETSEAMFLTQGFVYDSAEAAEARFKGDEPGFIYSRYANPDRRHVRKAHVRARRRRGRARHRLRHGGRRRRRCCARSRPATMSSPRARCSARAAR